VAALAGAMRLRDLGEREGPLDGEPESPRLNQVTYLGQRVEGRAVLVSAAEVH
jgi:hypothetical protein